MEQGKVWREFTSLPPEYQQQVADFIAFLRHRYEQLRPVKKDEHLTLAEEPFIGIWRDQDDMADSSVWVQKLRRQEWTKAG